MNRPCQGPALHQAAEQVLHVRGRGDGTWKGQRDAKWVVGHRHVGVCLRATDPSQEAIKGPLVQSLSHAQTDAMSWTKKEETLREAPSWLCEPEKPADGLVNHKLDLEVCHTEGVGGRESSLCPWLGGIFQLPVRLLWGAGCYYICCLILRSMTLEKVSGSSVWLNEGESGACHDLSAFLSGPSAAKERSMGTEVTAVFKWK